jgi:uncharacterized protein (TIGR03435 family)
MNALYRSLWPALVLTTLASFAQSVGPKVGDAPPLLHATELLQAPPDAKFDAESLRGKVVVLEFWATWCGPCVAAIPHLNGLSDKFAGQPVQFIAITAEDQATVESFLKKRPMKAWIALDTDRAMNKAYDISSIPHTVVLDRDGKIAAITYPTTLTAQYISDLIAGKKISMAHGGGETVPAQQAPEKGPPPLYEVTITPSVQTNHRSSFRGGGRMGAPSSTVRQVIPMMFRTNDDRIVVKTDLPTNLYDFSVVQPRKWTANPEKVMQEAVENAFGLAISSKSEERDVLLLKVKSAQAPGLTESPTRSMSYHSGYNAISGVGLTARAVAGFLEEKLNVPVLDETGLANENGYDVSLKWEQKSPRDKTDPEVLKKALLEQLGLELVPARRSVEVLVVESASKAKHP